MGLFDKLARKRHENTEDTKNVAAGATPAKKVAPPSPTLDSEERIAYQQGFDCYREGKYEEAARLYRISADLGFFRAQYALALSYMEGYGVKKDLAEAEMWAKKAADQGYEAAATLVKEIQEKQSATSDALALGMSFYEQEDYEQAVHHFCIAANSDHADAQVCLAFCYATGRGVEKDLDTAEMWAKRALDSGDEKAAELLENIHKDQRADTFNLGVACLERGDYPQAAQHFRTAAEQGVANAQFNLAVCYFKGKGVEQNLDMAILWAERAHEQGFKNAAELLELLQAAKEHPFDLGVACFEKDDFEQAVLYFRIAAERGDAKAQFNLALCYEYGKGAEKSLPEAVRWYQAAAEQGDQKAAEALARLRKKEASEAFNLGVACHKKGDFPQAAQHFRTAAELGSAVAQFHLALCYFEGEGLEQNLDMALLWAERAHEQGFKNAAELLELLQAAKEYPFDLGVACFEKEDFEQAALFFRIAAEQGDAKAQFNLAICYSQGKGVEENQFESSRWYRKAAELGIAEAQFILARRYENGEGVEKNLSEAIHWYRTAAEQGNAKAQFGLAAFYIEGHGVEQSWEKALLWAKRSHEQGYELATQLLEHFEKLKISAYEAGGAYLEGGDSTQAAQCFRTSAELGHAEAQFLLALCYEIGTGVDESDAEAFYWHSKAAQQGHASAQFDLAIRYKNGKGVEQDLEQAMLWAKRAHEQGFEAAAELLDELELSIEAAKPPFLTAAEAGDANAQFDLALRYVNGDGVEQDQSKAVHWYQKAAEQGHAKAQFNLAVRYENGNGVERDQTKAVHWYLKAAQQGHGGAQFNLAVCYRDGDGVQEDQWKASHWFHMAAEQGDAVAQFNLAVRYEEGRGVYQNQSEAIRWYRAAAQQGYASAQYNLAICYRDGDGVAINLDEAEMWAERAQKQGHESAPNLLEGIRQRKNNR